MWVIILKIDYTEIIYERKPEGRVVLDKAKCPAFVNIMVGPLVL